MLGRVNLRATAMTSTPTHPEAYGPFGPRQPPRTRAWTPAEVRRRLRATPVHVRWIAAILTALVAAIVAFFLLFQWNWLRPPLAELISGRLHRPVSITGDLSVHPWSFSPWMTVRGLTIGNPAWAGREPMTEIPALTVQVKLTPLLRGQTILPLVAASRPRVHLLRDSQGRANWEFGAPGAPSQPLRLPAIRHFIIDDGSVRINDAQRRLVFVGTVTSNERAQGPTRGVFHLIGQGTLNGQAFTAHVTGAPLLNVAPDRPYPFDAHVTAGATRVDATGIVPHPFDLGWFSTQLAVQGPNAADLYLLTGLAFPRTPPYRVSGAFERNVHTYDYRHFAGRVGESDLAGSIHVVTDRHPRTFVSADLASRTLHMADLMALVGGGPTTTRAASPQQAAEAQHLRATGRVLPDVRLNTSRLGVMDADIRYRAASVTAGRMPLRSLSLRARLRDARLAIDPLALSLPQGQLAGGITIDGRRSVPTTSLDLRLTGARLEEVIPARGTLSGGLLAHVRLVGTGASVREAASNANGQFTVVIPHGQIRQAFAELMGVNAARGLFLLLSHSNSQSPINCAVADFHASNGVVTTNNMVFDTDVVASHGRGVINMRDETLDLRLEGRAKHFRLIRVMAPLTLRGTFAHPRPGIDLGAATGQFGIGALLGAAISPLAAVLPFIDPGTAHGANCPALLAGVGR